MAQAIKSNEEVWLETPCIGYDWNHMNSSFTQVHKELAGLLPTIMLQHCETRCVKKGERLFATGNKPAHMFYVGSGEILSLIHI